MAKNLLVMRLSAMGDVAMTVPVIASFLNAYPDMQITMLSNPRLEPLFSAFDRIKFVSVDTKKEYAGNLGMYRLFKKLKNEYTFDAMIDLHDVLRSKILRTLFKWFTKVPVYVIEKGRTEKKDLVSGKDRHQLKSSIQRYIDVFNEAGYPFPINSFHFPTEQLKASAEVREMMAKKQTKWIGIAPFAQHQGKIYPIEKTEQVIRQLTENPELSVLLFGGGAKEKSVLDDWANKYPQTISLAGKFSLQEELLLIEKCDVLLSMDSANMHLASLVGTKVISIWGATHPYAGFYGFQQDEKNAIQLEMDCRPCSIYGNKPCSKGNYPCLQEIKENTVVEKIMEAANLNA